jgi:hypothetical protein
MDSFENRLAAIGLSPIYRAPECWRVERLGAPRCLSKTRDADLARGRALSMWLDRLGETHEPRQYRIRPVGESN